jgi:energy-coupling factor transporter transmembrane protein EcfT
MKYFDRMALTHLVMVFVGSYIPSILLFLNTLCTVRSSKDPVRTAFTYLKFGLLAFSAHALFDTATYGFYLFSSLKFSENYHEPDFDWARYATLIKALGIFVRAFQAISKLSDVVADILITIILLRLSTATITVFSGNATGKKLRLASYGAAFVLSALAFIVFGLQIRYIYEISENDVEIGLDCYLKSVQIEFAVRVLLFVISLGVLVRAVMVKKQIKADKDLTWVRLLTYYM